MSTNKTTNLNLNSWVETDAVDYEEVNENFNIIDNALKDYVVDYGTNDFWTWRKWNSGRCELYGTSAHETISGWEAYGGLSYKQLSSPAFPFTVIDNHVVSIQPVVNPNPGEAGYGLYFAVARTPRDNVTRVHFYLVTARSEDTFTGQIRYFVTGWWK